MMNPEQPDNTKPDTTNRYKKDSQIIQIKLKTTNQKQLQ